MISFVSFLGIIALLLLSVTRRRILIICAFYVYYGLATVMNPDSVLTLGGLTVYRMLYIILLLSIGVRIFQDNHFLLRVHRWPLASFLLLLFVMAVSAFYSPSNTVLSISEPTSFFARAIVISLFWLAASHIQEENDLLIFAGTTVLVSVVLSTWVIWTAGQGQFAAYRGGGLVNENYVSMFVLAGAIPLINAIFAQKIRLLNLLFLAVLMFVMLAALILASRGMIAAVVAAAIIMALRLRRSLGSRKTLAVGFVVALVFCGTLFLPGAGNLLSRIESGDLVTLNERIYVWSYSLTYFSRASLVKIIFGGGMSSSASTISPMMPGVENYHNVYLLWLMEQGILGLTAFLVFLCFVTRLTLKSSHSLKNVLVGWLAYLLVAGLSATMSDDHAFWIFLGVLVGASSQAGSLHLEPSLQGVKKPFEFSPSGA